MQAGASMDFSMRDMLQMFKNTEFALAISIFAHWVMDIQRVYVEEERMEFVLNSYTLVITLHCVSQWISVLVVCLLGRALCTEQASTECCVFNHAYTPAKLFDSKVKKKICCLSAEQLFLKYVPWTILDFQGHCDEKWRSVFINAMDSGDEYKKSPGCLRLCCFPFDIRDALQRTFEMTIIQYTGILGWWRQSQISVPWNSTGPFSLRLHTNPQDMT